MGERRFPPNTFGWVELATTDRAAARDFYTDLLGWTTSDVDMGEMGHYTLLQMDGKDIAGMYNLTEEQKKQNVPSHWLSYVLVESTDETATKARELGAAILAGPFDVPGVGRMAIVADPTGAIFALFQPGDHPGAAPMDNRPGMFCWNELATRDTAKAKAFYTALFGWTAEEDAGVSPSGMLYTTFKNGDRVAGGMIGITQEMGDMPSAWTVYFAVADCDDAVARAAAQGARVVLPPMDIPDIGRLAVLTDSQGAAFSVMKLVNPEAN